MKLASSTILPPDRLDHLRDGKGVVGISLNNFVSRTPAMLEELFVWTKENIGEFDLLVGDFLMRHNYEAFDKLPEIDACDRAMSDGIRVTNRIRPVLAQAVQESRIISARSMYDERSFPLRLQRFEQEYSQNAGFRGAIDQAVREFLARRRFASATEKIRSHCVAYQLEELVLFELLAEAGYASLVYAGAHLPVMKSMVSKKFGGISRSLEALTLVEMRFFKPQ